MRMTAYDSWGERAALYMSVCVCRLGGELYAGTAVSTRHTAQHAWSGPAEPVSSLRALARSLLSFTRQQVQLCPPRFCGGGFSLVLDSASRASLFSYNLNKSYIAKVFFQHSFRLYYCSFYLFFLYIE